jgi:hypothetical protein
MFIRLPSVQRRNELHQVARQTHTNLGVLYCMLDTARAIEVCLEGLEWARKFDDLGF